MIASGVALRLRSKARFVMKYFPVAFTTAAVLFPAMAIAAKVGFYAGTFDPPTQAEIGIMR